MEIGSKSYIAINYGNIIDNYKFYCIQEGFGSIPSMKLYNGVNGKHTLSENTLDKLAGLEKILSIN